VTTPRKSFGSDNHSGAHPAVLRALAEANSGDATSYGADPWTARAAERLCDLFGASAAFFVFNGTAANVLGISPMLRPFEAVICAQSSHLNVDECGAAERILGCKLLLVDAPDGKLTPELIATRLSGRNDEHRVQARVVEIAQVTEVGSCYSLAELQRLSEFCRQEGLLIYMDGARLANAAAFLDCKPAELAAGVDVLSFGGTKNGALGAEAVIVMRPDLAPEVRFHRKQQMQLSSKMRFLSAQFNGLLDDQLWLTNAGHANDMARRLASGVGDAPGVRLRYPVESNAVFAALDPARIERLHREWTFHVWDDDEHVVRWMTAFDTTEAEVDEFIAAVRGTASARSAAGSDGEGRGTVSRPFPASQDRRGTDRDGRMGAGPGLRGEAPRCST
jgi:threonine aldolase